MHPWQILLWDTTGFCLKITFPFFQVTTSCITAATEIALYNLSAHILLSEIQCVNTSFASLSGRNMDNIHQFQCFIIVGSEEQMLKSGKRRANGILLQDIKICPFGFM